MIVEFIGCSGAGKTTLANAVQRRLAIEHRVNRGDLTELFGLPSIDNSKLRNIVSDVMAFPFFLLRLRKHVAFVRFVVKTLACSARSRFVAAVYLRSIIRRIGMDEIFRTWFGDRVMLVDEGTVLSAHHLFVYVDAAYRGRDIATFSNLVPRPDLLICIRAPAEDLIARAEERRDQRWELRTSDEEQRAQYVCRATELFEDLCAMEGLKDRVLRIDNPGANQQDFERIVDNIARFIQSHCIPAEFAHPESPSESNATNLQQIRSAEKQPC